MGDLTVKIAKMIVISRYFIIHFWYICDQGFNFYMLSLIFMITRLRKLYVSLTAMATYRLYTGKGFLTSFAVFKQEASWPI